LPVTSARSDPSGSPSRSLRIGTGAGFSADRLDPALDLVARGALDYIVFECVGERTLAFGHRDRLRDTTPCWRRASARSCRCAGSGAPAS
jgi:hypothetical protein